MHIMRMYMYSLEEVAPSQTAVDYFLESEIFWRYMYIDKLA